MNDDFDRKITSLNAIGQLIGAEGFSDHAANEVKRYWMRRHFDERQKGRFAKVKRAFGQMVADKLSDGDRVVLGRYIALLCKLNFDTGLRLGLVTLVADAEEESRLGSSTG